MIGSTSRRDNVAKIFTEVSELWCPHTLNHVPTDNLTDCDSPDVRYTVACAPLPSSPTCAPLPILHRRWVLSPQTACGRLGLDSSLIPPQVRMFPWFVSLVCRVLCSMVYPRPVCPADGMKHCRDLCVAQIAFPASRSSCAIVHTRTAALPACLRGYS